MRVRGQHTLGDTFFEGVVLRVSAHSFDIDSEIGLSLETRFAAYPVDILEEAPEQSEQLPREGRLLKIEPGDRAHKVMIDDPAWFPAPGAHASLRDYWRYLCERTPWETMAGIHVSREWETEANGLADGLRCAAHVGFEELLKDKTSLPEPWCHCGEKRFLITLTDNPDRPVELYSEALNSAAYHAKLEELRNTVVVTRENLKPGDVVEFVRLKEGSGAQLHSHGRMTLEQWLPNEWLATSESGTLCTISQGDTVRIVERAKAPTEWKCSRCHSWTTSGITAGYSLCADCCALERNPAKAKEPKPEPEEAKARHWEAWSTPGWDGP